MVFFLGLGRVNPSSYDPCFHSLIDGRYPEAGAYEFDSTNGLDKWVAGAQSRAIAFDDFESGEVSGGSGWSSSWTLSGDAALMSNGYHGAYGLRLRGSDGLDYASRTVDLRNIKVGTISFWWRAYGLSRIEDRVVVKITDGENAHNVRIISPNEAAVTDGVAWSEWRFETIDLTRFNFSADVQTITLDASSLNNGNATFYMDDISVCDYGN